MRSKKLPLRLPGRFHGCGGDSCGGGLPAGESFLRAVAAGRLLRRQRQLCGGHGDYALGALPGPALRRQQPVDGKGSRVVKACQVLVLDSPHGRWRVEHQFTANNLRLGSLKAITFQTDGKGNRIAPVPMLLAAPDVARGPVQVFCRDDETEKWVPGSLGSVTKYTTTRAIGFHRDGVTGVDHVLAGTDTLGVLSGSYDPAAASRIRWLSAPELQTPEGERVMGFCDCNGVAYCATSRHIFRRTDGPSPSWQEVYFCPQEIKPCGIRGLTAVPNPRGSGEALWFAALSKARRLDPADGFKETIELGIPAFLTRSLGVRSGLHWRPTTNFCPTPCPARVRSFGCSGLNRVTRRPWWKRRHRPSCGCLSAKATTAISPRKPGTLSAALRGKRSAMSSRK